MLCSVGQVGYPQRQHGRDEKSENVTEDASDEHEPPDMGVPEFGVTHRRVLHQMEEQRVDCPDEVDVAQLTEGVEEELDQKVELWYFTVDYEDDVVGEAEDVGDEEEPHRTPVLGFPAAENRSGDGSASAFARHDGRPYRDAHAA